MLKLNSLKKIFNTSVNKVFKINKMLLLTNNKLPILRRALLKVNNMLVNRLCFCFHSSLYSHFLSSWTTRFRTKCPISKYWSICCSSLIQRKISCIDILFANDIQIQNGSQQIFLLLLFFIFIFTVIRFIHFFFISLLLLLDFKLK